MSTEEKFSLNRIWKICFFILIFFSLFIGLFLAYYGTVFSYYSATDGSTIRIIRDSLPTNLLTFAAAVGLTMLLEYLLGKFPGYRQRASYLFLAVCCLLFFAIGCIWTTQLPYYPSGDQLNTTAAAQYSLEGNYIMFDRGGYIGIYSQQKGLVFLYEILFSLFGPYCYNVVEKLHVLSGVIVMIFGFLFLKDVSDRCVYRFIYCASVLFCAPYIILMPYAYGDIPSVCFCVVMFWALQRYGRALQNRYAVIAALMAILALFARQNSWIVLIAAGIGLFLTALEKRSIYPIIAASCIILSAALSIKVLNVYYEIRSGYEDTGGTPASLYFAMGMQDGDTGPGTYNRFNQGTYESVDFDRDAAAEIGWQEVQNRLQFFRENPNYAVTFFKTKLQLQWLEPLFETLRSTDSFPQDSAMPQWINEIYYGKYHDPLFRFANSYQSVTYLSLLAYVVFLFKKRNNSLLYVPLIALVGGFLFSIIWEAQCRYVLPYYMFMMVYVPIGLCNVGDAIRWLVNRLLPGKKVAPPAESTEDKSAAA